MFRLCLGLVAVIISCGVVQAHPGESLKSKRAEAKYRADYLASLENTDLAHCAGSLASRGVVERTIHRRRSIVDGLQAQVSDVSSKYPHTKINSSTL
jgi:hypothetical protein